MECSFKDIVYDHSFPLGFFSRRKEEWEAKIELYSFIQGKNFEIIKTKFQECKTGYLLEIADSTVEGCRFDKCTGYFEYKQGSEFYSFLLKVENTNIHSCELNQCISASLIPYVARQSTEECIGIIFIKEGELSLCKFKDCDIVSLCYSDEYERNTYFSFIFAIKSKIVKTSFNKSSVKCIGYQHKERIKSISMLRLDDAEEMDNMFGECLCKEIDDGDILEQEVINIERK